MTRVNDAGEMGRRELLQALGLLIAAGAAPVFAQAKPLRIGIIGTGRIGGALATHWTKAGHEVLMSSRHPEELRPLAASLGARARVGTPREAAEFGEVILVSVPYGAMPQIGKDNAAQLKGKVVLDTSNPVEGRDGAMAVAAVKKGAGVATAEYLPGTRVVRAFNCIPAASLANNANRKPERIAIPIGGDDKAAVGVAERLIRDAGFDPVNVGSLAQTRQFDLGQPLATGNLTAAEMRKALAR
jgi:8-hydroxy-5-deazaflavin:NADPH oxidoreductase